MHAYKNSMNFQLKKDKILQKNLQTTTMKKKKVIIKNHPEADYTTNKDLLDKLDSIVYKTYESHQNKEKLKK